LKRIVLTETNRLNKSEYTHVVQVHQVSLYRFALNFLGSSEDARDIVQDVFVKLWLNVDRIDQDKVKSWLFTCTHNAMLNFIKRRARIDYMQSIQLQGTPYMDAHEFESNEIIERTVGMLPPLQKSILLMRDLEGYSYEEIGVMLNLSPSQVKVYLFRARVKVKNQLKTVHHFA
jgi:RNA polymerase sigma-70 factor (ECF subfamily)